MEDIGMSPDYRSGHDGPLQCTVCLRYRGDRYIETCAYCGKAVCRDCCTINEPEVICDPCCHEQGRWEECHP